MFIDLLKQELGDAKEAGGEVRFNCPFCGEHKHKMYVCNHGKKEGQWTCFKCGQSGNPISFVTEYFLMTYTEAVDLLLTYDYDVKERGNNRVSLSQYSNELSEEEKLMMFIMNQGEPIAEDKAPQRLVCPKLPTNTKTLIANFNNPEAFPFFMYLHSRGVTLELIKEHNISYVINGDVELKDGRKLTLRNHVIFFTFDKHHKPLYWNTRSIEKDPFIKSFNAPSRDGEYSKENTVFNLNNVHNAKYIFIHEGVFNSFMTPSGGLATFGKQITDEQLHLILQTTTGKPIFLMLDTDAWEQMIKAAHRIHAIEPNRKVFYTYSGLEEDVNDIGPEGTKLLLSKAFLADSDGDLNLRMKVLNNYKLTELLQYVTV